MKHKTVKRNRKCLVCTYNYVRTCFSRNRPSSVNVEYQKHKYLEDTILENYIDYVTIRMVSPITGH